MEMEMESQPQISLDTEVRLHQVCTSVQDGDPVVVSTTPDRSEPQQPVGAITLADMANAAKKTTRQWAAWTHQEEESFFTALRQVGKNFEKITRRVQSKNKDQVRHYYYRLVRRMNKLLGPGLCLDAKNSKDTNAAMLRWWSLLEKYSCKASKLHLKPRRFKIFIEALENQLIKDRKKNVRKRPSQGENSSPVASSLVTNHNRASGHDSRMVKLVLVDSENVQKFGASKGSLKRNGNIGVICSNKGDSAFVKSTRQRRKQGIASSAAYKRWEKAAIAGVSLVADAAEHLERTATSREVENDQGMPGLKCSDSGQRVVPLPLSSHDHFLAANVQTKLKLQLFPVDDTTRKSLEMDNHNPHLELTLSIRKKISSVLEHLNRKWGNSSVAAGQLMLLPFTAHKDNLVVSQGWTQESVANAADVYTAIGSPPLFRLRYGWFFNNELVRLNWRGTLESSQLPREKIGDHGNGKGSVVGTRSACGPSTSDPSLGCVSLTKHQATAIDKNDIHANPPLDVSNEINAPMGARVRNELIESYNSAANVQWYRKEGSDKSNNRRLDEADDPRLNNGTGMSTGEWADSLTNISVGDLLSEVPPGVNDDCIEPLPAQSDMCLQQTPFSCDSFDAAIAAHLSKHQKMVLPNTEASNAYSIWDAEETCDAFAFQKTHIFCQEVPAASVVASPSILKQTVKSSSMDSDCQESPDMDEPVDSYTDRDLMSEHLPDSCIIDSDERDLSGLTDISWPDSLGPLDLDLPSSSKYLGNDLILNDSLSGVNRLIASSLDAFQNCSFLGVDKKDSPATVESRDAISFSDFKIRGGL